MSKKFKGGSFMPKIATKYTGEITVEAKDMITFEQGLPGFVTEKEFVILPFAEQSPFFILQSMTTADLAFILTEPFTFFQDYDFKLEETYIEQLHIQSEHDVTIFVILTVHDPFENTTANLQAPLVINKEKKTGKQVILSDSRYGPKHVLMNHSASSQQGRRHDARSFPQTK